MNKQLEYEVLLNKEIGKLIRELRTKKGLTLKEVSEDICSISVVSDIELGMQKIPNILMLSKISKKLDVNLSDLIKIAEDKILDGTITGKKKILNLISLGKYLEAEKLGNEILQIDSSLDDYKYSCYIKGVIAFYNGNYLLSNNYFLKGLGNSIKKIVDSKNILCLIELFLANGLIANLFKLHPIGKEVHNREISNLLYLIKDSIDYYLLFETKLILRLKINLSSYFRLYVNYEVCKYLNDEIELVIEEFVFSELRINFSLEKIMFYHQTNKIEMIDKTITKSIIALEVLELFELKKEYENIVSDLKKKLKILDSSNQNKLEV